jgi:hypothetical protein
MDSVQRRVVPSFCLTVESSSLEGWREVGGVAMRAGTPVNSIQCASSVYGGALTSAITVLFFVLHLTRAPGFVI